MCSFDKAGRLSIAVQQEEDVGRDTDPLTPQKRHIGELVSRYKMGSSSSGPNPTKLRILKNLVFCSIFFICYRGIIIDIKLKVFQLILAVF